RGPPGASRAEGNGERRAVDEEAVARLAVLAERLAVIGGERHERRAGPRVPRREQPPQRVVREGDLAAVGIAAAELGGRVVGGVGIEEVDPDEYRPRSTGEPA